MTDDATAARRKAMAKAIRRQLDMAWPSYGFDGWKHAMAERLAEAADVAAEKQRKEVP